MNILRTETWSLEEISNCLTKRKIDGRKIVIPIFQRGKRWKPTDKIKFIDSLKKNYPIGSLLFFKKQMNNQEIYILIDGLQRSTTIKEYLKNPTQFFSVDQIDESVWLNINKLLNNSEINIKYIVNQYVSNLQSFDKFDTFELIDMICKHIPDFSEWRSLNNFLKPSIEILKNNYNELAKVTIPVIVYTGPESSLPEIFERINKEGHPLDDYDIYSASWPEDKFHIENEKIITHILEKYDMLSDDDFCIDNYDRDNLRINKNVSAFEYMFGFSKWITTEYEILRFNPNMEKDVANHFGFELLNACFNSSHNQIKDLYIHILKNCKSIKRLEDAIIFSIEYVENHIAAITKFKGNTHNKTPKIFHSQFQIMSLISFVFRCRYDIDNLDILNSWEENEKMLSKNIVNYYIYDILNKTWSEGGTNKIHTANIEKRYLYPISKGQFISALDSLNEERLSRNDNKTVKSVDDSDYVILNTIYMQTFTALDQLSIYKFDVEHIATKNLLKKLINITNGNGLPISHIANLCYLPEKANRSKQDYTFYQDNEWLEKTGFELKDIESKYSFTNKEDLEWIDLGYTSKDFEYLKKFYIDYLRDRYIKIKEKFLCSLGYDLNETEEINLQSINFNEDNYYRLTKIGQLVKESFRKIIDNNLLTYADLKELQDKNYCLDTLGCALPVLVVNKENTFDSNGRSRYYVDTFEYNGVNYYLCREWYENDRKKIVPWIKNKLAILNK